MKRDVFWLWLSITLLSIIGDAACATPTDPVTRMKSWQHHVKLKNESVFKDLRWRAVGPRFIGGRIESIAVPAGNNYTIYAGVGSGNIWKTISHRPPAERGA